MFKNEAAKVETPPTNRGVTMTVGSPTWSGVDYFTSTSRKEEVGHKWYLLWNRYRLESREKGDKVTVFERFGYNCQTIGGLTYGKSKEFGYLMTASSDAAHLTWQKVLPSASNITRLDLQFTFIAEMFTEQDNVGPIMRQYLGLKESDYKSDRTYSCMENSRGGETLYVGARSSNQFGRMYNKSIESGLDVSHVYRLEVEYKKPRSFELFNQMYNDTKKGLRDPLQIRDVVLSWFERRGIVVSEMFRRVDAISIGRTLNSDEKKFKWLRTSVAPTLVDLAERGMLKELAEALRLTEPQYRQLAMFSQGDVKIHRCKHALMAGVCQKCGQCFT